LPAVTKLAIDKSATAVICFKTISPCLDARCFKRNA
jgi:hypothetical protein